MDYNTGVKKSNCCSQQHGFQCSVLTLLGLLTQIQSLPGAGSAWGAQADSWGPGNSGGGAEYITVNCKDGFQGVNSG